MTYCTTISIITIASERTRNERPMSHDAKIQTKKAEFWWYAIGAVFTDAVQLRVKVTHPCDAGFVSPDGFAENPIPVIAQIKNL